MTTFSIGNLPVEMHRTLRNRAAIHERTSKSDARLIVDVAVTPPNQVSIASTLPDSFRPITLHTANNLILSPSKRHLRPADHLPGA